MSNEPTGTAATPYTWYVIWLLFAINMLNYVDRMILAVLIEDIRQEIPMTDTQIGILTGLAFAAFYSIAGVLIGRLSDLFSRKKILMAGISVWSLATAVTGFAGNFVHLLLARLFVGAGEAGNTPASYSLLADFCNFQIRPIAYAIFSSGGSIGLMVGLALGGYLADTHGWRTAFFAAGFMGVPFILLVFFTLRDPERGIQDGVETAMEGTKFLPAVRFLFAKRSFLPIVFASVCNAFVLFGVAQWVPAFLIRQFGLSASEVGLYFGLAMGGGTAIGAIGGGLVTNRLVERNVYWLLFVPMIAAIAVFPFYLVVLYGSSVPLVIVAVFAVNIVGSIGFGPLTASMQSIVPAGMRGTATAFFGLATSLLGVGLAPFAIGLMSDWLGGGAQDAASLQMALTVAICVGLGAALFLHLAKSTFKPDQVQSVET
ncbi:Predicted arabinose efflux permease, MFS family [Parasphingorhabdus marina DSM 22363]|uniref:Predicted arabinose efflux permease, MFS family n=1 Tax=Parasphingorhabdus marina DSM 22363 TaxID=1123272 RepID=A0A1N6D126_9SPHN|nr:MFS transporter [Parasphingorhabdus marina]SIN64485.1 Predicted arabinose efflux permease, MFS family [Parasphingorhabdus marina DSM 22363]